MRFLILLIIGAVVVLVGLPGVMRAWYSAGPMERLWMLLIGGVIVCVLIPPLRGLLKYLLPLLIFALAALYLYNTITKLRDAGLSWAETAEATALRAWSSGWDSTKKIAKSFIPKLGAGTLTSVAGNANQANQKYVQCMQNATSQLPDAFKPQGAACAAKPPDQQESCLSSLLSAHDETIAAWQICRQNTQVIGQMADDAKTIANSFCLPFMPEFIQDVTCVDRNGNRIDPNPLRLDQPYVDCVWAIMNDRSSGHLAVDASSCLPYQNDRAKMVQCAVDRVKAAQLPGNPLQYCANVPAS